MSSFIVCNVLNEELICDSTGFVLYLQVIVLDTRYHRDPLRSDGSILGDTQWGWLEKELRGPRSEITIIGSSVQVFY